MIHSKDVAPHASESPSRDSLARQAMFLDAQAE
jgi:hypothetical protein